MPEIEAAGHRPTIKRRRLSNLLTSARLQCGLTQPEVANRLGPGWSRGKLAYIENRQWLRPNPRDVRELCQLYGIGKRETEALCQLALDARTKGWWRRYDDVFGNDFPGLEADASRIRAFESLFVPGLVQTPAYVAEVTRAFSTPPEEMQRRITARLERQQLLDRTEPPPPVIHMVIDEGALLRRFGTVDEHREQIQRIIDLGRRDHITVQVLRLADGLHAGMNGAFELLDFPDEQDLPIVYLESELDNRLLEEDDEVARYSLVWDKVCDAALDDEATLVHLEKIMESLE